MKEYLRAIRTILIGDKIKKVHIVAIVYGVAIGGFIGGFGVGASGGSAWWIAAGTVGGSVVGAYLLLTLVPRKDGQ